MTLSWIECKVTYERPGEKGLNTKVNEVYLTQGFTFTEVEKRITMELQPQVTGSFDINKMERTKYNELVNCDEENADKWFKCKIVMRTIDEVSAKEKKTSVVHLEGLPGRPPKTTKLRLEMTFTDPLHVKLMVKDLGFGELYPRSDMKYEGELQWEQ